MTFGSHAYGNTEWSFGDHLPTPKAEFWWAGPLGVIISVGWKTICRIPQHFLPPSPNATCWKNTEKWKVELTCDSGFRNQSSCCLFQTIASAGRPSNWRETTRALRLGTGVSVGLGFPGQPNPRKHGRMMQALLWVTLWTKVVIKWRNKIYLDLKTTMILWGGFLLNHERVDFKLIMKQYWLLCVENDKAIVRNGCEKEDLKIWKKQIFISWFSAFFFLFLWVLDESGPSIYSGETKNGRWVVENVGWEFLVRLVAQNGRWER